MIANALTASGVTTVVKRRDKYAVIGELNRIDSPKLPAIAGPPMSSDSSWARFLAAVLNNHDLISQGTDIPEGTYYALFIASKDPIKASLRRLLLAELVGTALVIALAFGVVGVAVKLTLRPLDRMAVVAGKITMGDISQRLRPDNPSTELGKLGTSFDAMLDSLAKSLTSERKAHERASRSEEQMRNFLSDASHELRTPIAGLQWSAEALLRHGHKRDRRDQLAFQIAKQASRASKLVADLLAIARLDEGTPLERGRLDLAALAEEEVERVREQEPGLDLRLSSTGDCLLVADGERVRQAVSNLIDNARKAVDGKGTIEVSVHRNDKSVELEVADSGPGVPEADRERIFERFVRLDDSRHRDDYGFGSGLGLAIARGIAEAHGGRLVCAESASGARFVLTLPLGGRARRPASAPVERTRASAS